MWRLGRTHVVSFVDGILSIFLALASIVFRDKKMSMIAFSPLMTLSDLNLWGLKNVHVFGDLLADPYLRGFLKVHTCDAFTTTQPFLPLRVIDNAI